MLISAMIPLTLWKLGPKWLHPYLMVLLVLILIGAVIALVLYIRRGRREAAELPSRAEYRWLSGLTVLRYHRLVMTWLKVQGWLIYTAQAVDEDRLRLCLGRDRARVTMLLVRPEIEAGQLELERLAEFTAADGTWDRVLVSGSVPRVTEVPPAGMRIFSIGYEDLPRLASLLLEEVPHFVSPTAAGAEAQRLRDLAALQAQMMGTQAGGDSPAQG